MAKKISELPLTTHSNLTSSARLLVNEVDAQSSTGYTTKQVSIAELGAEIAENVSGGGSNSGSDFEVSGEPNDGDTIIYRTRSSGGEWSSTVSLNILDTSGAHDGYFIAYNSGTGNIEWKQIGYNAPTSGDFLTYSAGSGPKWSSTIPISSIDCSSASDGDCLMYIDGCGGPSLQWSQSNSGGNGIDMTNAYTGYLLTVDDCGQTEWTDPMSALDWSGTTGDVLIYSDNGPEWSSTMPISSIDCSDASDGDILMYIDGCGGSSVRWSSTIPISSIDSSYGANGQCLMYIEGCGADPLIRWSYPISIDNADGKYLTFTSDCDIPTYTWENIDPSYIDSSNAADGQCLMYIDGCGGPSVQWSYPINISSASDGDYLRYSSNSGLYWSSQ